MSGYLVSNSFIYFFFQISYSCLKQCLPTKRRMNTYGKYTFGHRERNRILYVNAHTATWIMSEIESMKIAAFKIFTRKIKKDSSYSKLQSIRDVCRSQFKKMTRMGLNVPVSLL